MCDECGCGNESKKSAPKAIIMNRSVTEANDIIAREISNSLKEKFIFCVNIMGSPGSGKTTLIEELSVHLGSSDISVIQGDLESDLDKIRLEKKGIQTYQINTHSGCHLSAAMIRVALDSMDQHGKKYLFIENVGNLVCPAGVDIGQHMNIVVSSTAEGSDKPRKYPLVFLDSDLIIISKCDLKAAVLFDENQYIADVRNISVKSKIINVSSKEPGSFMEAARFIEHMRGHFFKKSHHHHHINFL